MNFEIVQKLVDDPLFRYDRKSGELSFQGTYQNQLHTRQSINHFLEEENETKLVDKKDRRLLQEAWHGVLAEGEVVSVEVPLLTAAQKYEMFRVKGIYAKAQDAIVGIVRNIEAERRAVTDSLTGLWNRDGMEQAAPAMLNAANQQECVALYLLDLDNFKEVNDTKGHLLGDELLREVAEVLREVFEPEAYLGRIGGDEFLMIARGQTSTAAIGQKADLVCGSLAKRFREKSYAVTASIGVAVTVRPMTYQTLFSQADAALYVAKSSGKNRYCFFSPELRNARYTNGRSVGNGMNGAIVQDQSFTKCHILFNEALDIINRHCSLQETITEVAKLVVEEFDITRAYASCYMPDGSRIGKSYFYAKDGAPNIPPKLKLNRDEYVKNYNEEGIFFCTDVTKTNEPLRSELIRMEVESLLQFLVYDTKGNVIGTVGVNNSGEKRLWMQDEIDILQSIAKLLTRTVEELQQECVEEENMA